MDTDFVNDLFGSKEEFLPALHAPLKEELPVIITKYGGVMGSDGFLKSALKKHDRRKRPTLQSKGAHRTDEKYFDPIEKVLCEYERMKEIDIDAIDTGTFEGKRLRGELLVALKERTGLKYREIAELDIFEGLSLISLRTMYKNYRSRYRKG